MKSLKYFIQEGLKDDKQPKNLDELRTIIVKRFQEQGFGTKKQPIDFNDIDVSNINTFFEDGVGLFQEMEERKIQFKYIDISKWDVSNVENMSAMFYNCKNLKYVGDLSNWDVSNVKDMQDMFADCKKLKSIGDISNWDTRNVKNTRYMFNNSGITNTPDWYEE